MRHRTTADQTNIHELRELCEFYRRHDLHSEKDRDSFRSTREFFDALMQAAREYLKPIPPDPSTIIDMFDYLRHDTATVQEVWGSIENPYEPLAAALFRELASSTETVELFGNYIEQNGLREGALVSLPTGRQLAEQMLEGRFLFLIHLTSDGMPYVMYDVPDDGLVIGSLRLGAEAES